MAMYDLVQRFGTDPLDPSFSTAELDQLRLFYQNLESRFTKAINAGTPNFQLPGKRDEIRRKLEILKSRLGIPI